MVRSLWRQIIPILRKLHTQAQSADINSYSEADAIVVSSLRGCVLLLFVVIRWEEERYTDGSKWRFLEHKGPVFAPPYEPLPDKVKFYYDGESVCVQKLSCNVGIGNGIYLYLYFIR